LKSGTRGTEEKELLEIEAREEEQARKNFGTT